MSIYPVSFGTDGFVFKQKTAYEMRISDWSSDVCSSDLVADKAVADDDVDRALEDVVAFHVAVEIQGAAAQKLGGFLDDFVALDDFFADVEQAHGDRKGVV